MNVLEKYILLYLYADKHPTTKHQLEWGIFLLAQVPGFEELKQYLEEHKNE